MSAVDQPVRSGTKRTGDTPARTGKRVRALLSVRTLRLASGLVLFAYVLAHLLNHALLNVSLEAADAMLDGARLVWRSPVGTALLYGSLAIHAALGLQALYAKPRFAWSAGEAVQLALGLAIPPLLVGHVVGTRLAYTTFGTTGGYAQQLYYFFIASPRNGVLQAVALVAAWGHGCLGVYYWLRLKPWFPRAASLLSWCAVLVPALALFGYLGGGRAVAVLARDESWLIENAPVSDSTPAGAAVTAHLRAAKDMILAGFASLVGAALAARVVRQFAEMRRGLVRLTYPDGTVSRVPRGTSVLEASRRSGIRHASVCGGRGRCSTCRVRVHGETGRLPAAGQAERAVLDRVGAGADVRLACQLRPPDDLSVSPLVAPEAALRVARGTAGAFGEERYVVALFVDMRGSTRLAERHLPFDTVYLINRFLDAAARAVIASGGTPNQFLGDGLLALFGLSSEATPAARGAIDAVEAIGREIAALNALLTAELREPIRFGIGVHGGTAILGEIGSFGTGRGVFTAIGDPVNVAARLQSATKRLDCDALISGEVFRSAGLSPDGPAHHLDIEGRDGGIEAYPRFLATAPGLGPAGPDVSVRHGLPARPAAGRAAAPPRPLPSGA